MRTGRYATLKKFPKGPHITIKLTSNLSRNCINKTKRQRNCLALEKSKSKIPTLILVSHYWGKKKNYAFIQIKWMLVLCVIVFGSMKYARQGGPNEHNTRYMYFNQVSKSNHIKHENEIYHGRGSTSYTPLTDLTPDFDHQDFELRTKCWYKKMRSRWVEIKWTAKSILCVYQFSFSL